MIINHKSGKGGVVGKDGTTPHIGTNGNWFLGETDTGVAAQGKSDTRIETILLPVADWDIETFSQTITCTGVLEDETKQIITTVALPGNEEICETCHIICSAFAKDSLTFTATVMPETDIYLYVILENVSGGNNATSSVYSLEETVVGTWIDGKPIYRKTFIISSITNNLNLSMSGDISDLIAVSGAFIIENVQSPLPRHATGSDYCLPQILNNDIVLAVAGSAPLNKPAHITATYTKTTDTATIAIPSTTALMDAYEEGVNES